MPLYCWTCENGHKHEHFRDTPLKRNRRFRCKDCGLYMFRDYKAEHNISANKVVHLNRDEEPISHLLKKRSTKGHWVENLTPKPIYVSSSQQYEKLLKETHSREKGA